MTEPRYDDARNEERHATPLAGGPRRDSGRGGSSMVAWLVGLVVVVALVIAGFFLLGGDADTDTEGGEFDVDVEAPATDLDVDPPEIDVEVEPGDAEADATE